MKDSEKKQDDSTTYKVIFAHVVGMFGYAMWLLGVVGALFGIVFAVASSSGFIGESETVTTEPLTPIETESPTLFGLIILLIIMILVWYMIAYFVRRFIDSLADNFKHHDSAFQNIFYGGLLAGWLTLAITGAIVGLRSQLMATIFVVIALSALSFLMESLLKKLWKLPIS